MNNKQIEIDPKQFQKKYHDLNMTVDQVRKFYKMSPATFYDFIKRNKIPLKGKHNNGRPYKYITKIKKENERNDQFV